MNLADFIIDQLEAILQEWETFALTLEPAALAMTSKDLRNHCAVMLQALADDLRTTQTGEEQRQKSRGRGPRTAQDGEGVLHGIARLESHFTIEQLIAEFRALRASVLRLWSLSKPEPRASDLEDISRFNEAIDQLLAASVLSFVDKTRQAAEAEQRRKDEFLAMLAHELRNPLAPIGSAAKLLKMAKGNEAIIDRASDIIARQLRHMVTLVDDLLDVSRVTRGMIELKQEPLALDRIIADAVEQANPQIEARHHHLTVTALSETAIVRGDHNRLVQVLTNLLTNAAKYTPEGGHIGLGIELHSRHVILSVEDDGIGMAPDFQPHAFTLFAQAERTSDRSPGGLGLGLALVKSLIELHGGTVTCSSAGLGKGSRFAVCLPRQLQHEGKVERRGAARDNTVAGMPLKIMVVDDNADAAYALSLLLSAAGHRVITEYEAKRALEVARTEKPDACLLDIGLPEIDGNQLARQLRAQPETAKALLIAVTGYGRRHDRDDSMAAGFDHHMTKPVEIAKLLRVLAEFSIS